jgi:hypothetical protein
MLLETREVSRRALMTAAASIFIGVLEDEIKCWKEAALRCESVIPLLPANKQQMDWMMVAASYRQRAKALQTIIEEVSRKERGT